MFNRVAKLLNIHFAERTNGLCGLNQNIPCPPSGLQRCRMNSNGLGAGEKIEINASDSAFTKFYVA